MGRTKQNLKFCWRIHTRSQFKRWQSNRAWWRLDYPLYLKKKPNTEYQEEWGKIVNIQIIMQILKEHLNTYKGCWIIQKKPLAWRVHQISAGERSCRLITLEGHKKTKATQDTKFTYYFEIRQSWVKTTLKSLKLFTKLFKPNKALINNEETEFF